MKKASVSIILMMTICIFLVSCGSGVLKNGIWENATYTEDTELGYGSKVLYLAVTAEEKTVEFTVNTDKETVGEALLEHNLIAGEAGPYGLYVKTVNGILADYDINKTYWSFSKAGESMMQAVDVTSFEDGEHFELIYQK